MVVTIDCRDTINCKVTIFLCNRAHCLTCWRLVPSILWLMRSMKNACYSKLSRLQWFKTPNKCLGAVWTQVIVIVTCYFKFWGFANFKFELRLCHMNKLVKKEITRWFKTETRDTLIVSVQLLRVNHINLNVWLCLHSFVVEFRWLFHDNKSHNQI